jgi:lipoprotein-releasing system permease protein
MNFGAELHVARRYLVGIRRRTHVATVTLISLVGLGLGVFALVVTLALLEGFQSGIRAEIVARAAHAEVRPASGRRLEDPEKLASVLQASLGNVEIVQVVRGTCLVRSDVDAVPASVIGRSDTDRVTVDQLLARRVGVGAGDRLEVISARQRLTPMGPLPVRIRTEIQRIDAPEPGSDSGAVILPIGRAQQLLWGEPVVEAIELRDPEDPWRVGQRARQALANDGAPVEVAGLEELHRPLLTALALERVMIFLAVGLMLVVAALNLLCNVAMVAAEKRKDLAVMAGLGFTPRSLRRLFLVLGLAIGVVGSAIGAVAGSGLALILDSTEALRLPRGVFMVAAVPFRVAPETVALIVAVALVLAAVAAWLPARLVARREPAEGLRYE